MNFDINLSEFAVIFNLPFIDFAVLDEIDLTMQMIIEETPLGIIVVFALINRLKHKDINKM